MIEKLQELDLVEKIEDVMHRTPICERSKKPIEFIEMEEYYLKQIDILPKIREIADKISFYDPKSKKILLDWINTVNIDWPISRRRFYATEIPIWQCSNCGKRVVPNEKGKYWQPWKDECPIDKCPECGQSSWIGETRVLDTWFDSSISPLFNMKYNEDKEFYEKNPRCSLRPQGKEIVRTWLYYTLLRCYQITKKPIFKDVWIHYHVVDKDGKKFSKSKGNGVDPHKVIEHFGSEAFRLWCALEGNIHEIDLRYSDEKVKGFSKTLTKLWNTTRFISSFEMDGKYKLLDTDKWILNEVNKLIKNTKECYLKYDFNNPAKEIRHFIWETFSSHYLELVKSRAYNKNNLYSKEEKNGAIYTLNKVLKSILKLWAPVIPMITYKLYKSLYDEDIHFSKFPETIKTENIDFTKEDLVNINSEIWKYKRDNNLSLKSEIESVTLPKKFESIKKDLKVTHHINDLKFEKIDSLKFN